MPRDKEWEVRSERPGSYDLWFDRRVVALDYDTLEQALAAAKRRGALQVIVIEPDGYPVPTRI